MTFQRPTISKDRLDAMVEDATVDCYNEAEQVSGLFAMIEDNLAVPFETEVLGVSITVTSVDLTNSDQIVAMCSRDELRQAIPILDLPLPTPPPEGADWLEAYRRWLGRSAHASQGAGCRAHPRQDSTLFLGWIDDRYEDSGVSARRSRAFRT